MYLLGSVLHCWRNFCRVPGGTLVLLVRKGLQRWKWGGTPLPCHDLDLSVLNVSVATQRCNYVDCAVEISGMTKN